ncbi:MAG TPA: hypothetical protein VF155_05060 [Candidatus Dormibacteraeota bacterium]
MSDERVPTDGVECYRKPAERYAVDLEVPDPSQFIGIDFENVILVPHQLEIVEQHVPRPGEEGDNEAASTETAD